MSAVFAPGDRVRVRASNPPGHIRTPAYIRGKHGWVEQVLGTFRNPETLAYGEDGLPRKVLYQVGFRQVDVWDSYPPTSRDTIYVDVFEHWLEPIGTHHGERADA